MAKQISNHAAAAKMIRKEFKANGIKASVRASAYSGGSSVYINVAGLTSPAKMAAIEDFCGKFQYGNFDGMTDSYNYDNRNDDLPQVRFVTVSMDLSDSDRQTAYEWLRSTIGWGRNLPALLTEARGTYCQEGGEYIEHLVNRVISGRFEDSYTGTHFYPKARQQVRAA